jgi:hypothetical protein
MTAYTTAWSHVVVTYAMTLRWIAQRVIGSPFSSSPTSRDSAAFGELHLPSQPALDFECRLAVGPASHKAHDPGDVIHPNFRPRSLEVQSCMSRSQEGLCLDLVHDPSTPRLFPTCARTDLATKIDE